MNTLLATNYTNDTNEYILITDSTDFTQINIKYKIAFGK
jgi:hypothetical protein